MKFISENPIFFEGILYVVCAEVGGWGPSKGVVDILHVRINQPQRSLRTQQNWSYQNLKFDSLAHFPYWWCKVHHLWLFNQLTNLCDMSPSGSGSPSSSGFRKPLTPSKLRGCSNKLKTASAKLANTQPRDVTTTWKHKILPAPLQQANRSCWCRKGEVWAGTINQILTTLRSVYQSVDLNCAC